MSADRRPPEIRRSWLFVPGGDAALLQAAPESGADVLCQELEDFTAPEARPYARSLAPGLYDAWRAAGAVAAVRINPLAGDGVRDLEAVMEGRPDAVYLPKVDDPAQIADLDHAIGELEGAHGIAPGSTEIIPNVETARGLMRTYEIARASARVSACLVASEDMAADLGAPRSRGGAELAHARARFHLECVAAGVVSVDCPYTYGDDKGASAEARHARALGYTAKSLVSPGHAGLINRIMTPSARAVREAKKIVAAFEAARAGGATTVAHEGNLIELPTYTTATRLLRRAAAFGLD